MSFEIVTDTSANLPTELLEKHAVSIVPFSYFVEGEACTCENTTAFDGAQYYSAIRKGTKVTTSQINPQRYMECMQPLLERGADILYVGMSSGISGSYASAQIAGEDLREKFPERRICLVDTLSASLGEGLLVIRAIECRSAGMRVEETAELLLSLRHRMCQVFMVDDLMHLRRSGRISNIAALAGTVLTLKPLLKGDETGRIVTWGKVIGRKRAVEALATRYETLVEKPDDQIVGIAHADCPGDAARLEELLMARRPPKEILTVCYEPVTGAHVGPGALALFFFGGDDVRSK